MREYRIVATVDTEHGDGRKYHHDTATPWRGGTLFSHHPYRTKNEAKRVLSFLRKQCAEFDEKTRKEFEQNPRDCIAYKQTNIRVQMREVSEWADVE